MKIIDLLKADSSRCGLCALCMLCPCTGVGCPCLGSLWGVPCYFLTAALGMVVSRMVHVCLIPYFNFLLFKEGYIEILRRVEILREGDSNRGDRERGRKGERVGMYRDTKRTKRTNGTECTMGNPILENLL